MPPQDFQEVCSFLWGMRYMKTGWMVKGLVRLRKGLEGSQARGLRKLAANPPHPDLTKDRRSRVMRHLGGST
jgi:hypothetical protein